MRSSGQDGSGSPWPHVPGRRTGQVRPQSAVRVLPMSPPSAHHSRLVVRVAVSHTTAGPHPGALGRDLAAPDLAGVVAGERRYELIGAWNLVRSESRPQVALQVIHVWGRP